MKTLLEAAKLALKDWDYMGPDDVVGYGIEELRKCVAEIEKEIEIEEQVPCKTHPDAPHGFDRNASHSLDRYVCRCEHWEPEDEDHSN
jgi:hypothetical protein